MMTIYSARCKEQSFDVLVAISDAYLGSGKLIQSLERKFDFMSNNPFRNLKWLASRVIDDSEGKFDLVKGLIGRLASAPLAADILSSARLQLKGDSQDEPWVNEEQLEALEEIYQDVAVNALLNGAFAGTHLESGIFFQLERSSTGQAKGLISRLLEEEGGIIRVAEIIANSGTDSINGPFVQLDEEGFQEVIDIGRLRDEAAQVDIEELPVHLQAVIKSIRDGKKYYLRDATKGDRL